MSESESEISDFSQTLSEPEEEEMEGEDDNVQVIFSQIEPYQDEPLAEDDGTSEGNEVEEEAELAELAGQWYLLSAQRLSLGTNSF